MNGLVVPRGRRPLGANVAGYAAVAVVAYSEEKLETLIAQHHQKGRDDVARHLGATLADLREAAAQFQAACTEPSAAGPGSAEAVASRCGEGSEVLGDAPPRFHCEVDVRAAASFLRRSPRRVRQLLDAGELSGRKTSAGQWLIDEDDLKRLRAERRTSA